MLAIHLSLAAIAIAALMLRPRDPRSALVVGAAAIASLALGASSRAAITTVGPMVGFLTAALTLAAIVSETGLTDNIAGRLARVARGNPVVLYLLACALCMALTVVISLDGAVVLMVPLVLTLHRRHGSPLGPSLLGVVAVANTASIALPQGNPTNLVVIGHLHLAPASFAETMFVPGICAAGICAVIVCIAERRQLRETLPIPCRASGVLTRTQRHAAIALGAAALAAWVAPFVGVQPWWPFIAVVGLTVAATRRFATVAVPWRVAAQIGGLVIVVGALGVAPPTLTDPSLPILLAIAIGTGAVAVAINNLPASVWASALLTAGPVAYGATVGLAVGALAVPQGSVATLIAGDLAGDTAPQLTTRRLLPLAAVGTIVATVLLRVMLQL